MNIIKYDDIVKNYRIIIEYLISKSQAFSVITDITGYCDETSMNCEHDIVMRNFQPYIKEKIVGLKEWPGTIKDEIDKQKVMIIYECCQETQKLLLMLPNIFLSIKYNLPEDICFYKNQSEWFVTVSHERMAFMNFEEGDIEFLKRQRIKFYL